MPCRFALVAIALLAFAGTPASVVAQGIRGFCAGARKHVETDLKLFEAVEVVFGKPTYGVQAGQDAVCIYPLQVLRYGTADVLLTMGNEPGNACHGCSASLSAYVLARQGGGLKLVSKVIDFAQSGTFGDPGDISAVRIGGDDGIAIESGGTFQGHTFRGLEFYAFHAGRLIHVEAAPPIGLSASDEGAMGDGRPVTDVSGSWTIAPGPGDVLRVDYRVSIGKRRTSTSATWRLIGQRWVFSGGRIPAALKAETE